MNFLNKFDALDIILFIGMIFCFLFMGLGILVAAIHSIPDYVEVDGKICQLEMKSGKAIAHCGEVK